jgi:hypothetical protein
MGQGSTDAAFHGEKLMLRTTQFVWFYRGWQYKKEDVPEMRHVLFF